MSRTFRRRHVSVGVAIATYNSERHLRAQLESVVAQDTPVSSIVISDDGSTDSTTEMIADFKASHDGHVTVLLGRVGGVVANFERALEAIDSDLIFLCDHDDVWEPTKVTNALAAVRTGSIHMLFSDATLIDESGESTGTTLFTSLRVSRKERRLLRRGRALEVLVRRNVVTGATASVTRELVTAALPVPEEWLHDEWLAAIAACLGSLTLLDGAPTRYRQHGSNLIGVGSPSLRARLDRMRQSRADRHPRLLRRFTRLRDAAIGLDAPSSVVRLLDAKVSFEQARCQYPPQRWRRVRPICRQLLGGHYARYSSQGAFDAIRDLWV